MLVFPAARVAGQEEAPLALGSYRLEMIMASTTRVPFFGTSKSASKSVSLLQIRRDDGALLQSHKVCEMRVLEDSTMIKMVFPDRFIAALANHTYPIQLERDAHGWRYRADLGLERIGYKGGADAASVPTRIDDPEVYDWDGDGQPGATLKLSVPLLPDGELYVVQKGQSILNGRITRPGYVDGAIEYKIFEQRVLGAWPSFLNRSPEIKPDPKESHFSISPLPPGSTCESMKQAAAKAKAEDTAR